MARYPYISPSFSSLMSLYQYTTYSTSIYIYVYLYQVKATSVFNIKLLILSKLARTKIARYGFIGNEQATPSLNRLRLTWGDGLRCDNDSCVTNKGTIFFTTTIDNTFILKENCYNKILKMNLIQVFSFLYDCQNLSTNMYISTYIHNLIIFPIISYCLRTICGFY